MAGSLLKRNIADIKFEIAETDDLEDGNLLANVVVSQTDLIPGVYEGGMKTWECAVDLVNYLASLDPAELHGKRVIELGCGSSLPGIFCLTQDAMVDFQDYNEDVLRLVTIPNVLLNTTQRPSNPPTHTSVTFDAELDFSALSNMPSRFWAGDWGSMKETLAPLAEDEKYDIVLTSETIYASESHARLLDLIQAILKTDGVL
ncbi:hypothetical protein SpCBS45565_g06659 [Spizellomyces sp. 'palustris']|nr:hypothetical protein SpCBS45565_g06659 [Spizellomyces sp. 'palustris']